MKKIILGIFYVSPVIDSITGYLMGISGTENYVSKIYRIVAFSVLYIDYLRIGGVKKIAYQLLATGYVIFLLLCITWRRFYY